jgi:hypothetical protein
LWITLGTANLFGALAAGLGILVAAAGDGATAAFYVGFAGSLGLLAGAAILARRNLPGARMEQLGDAVLLGTLVIALGGYCVAIPGFTNGDALLTSVFLVDLCALLLGALATLAGPVGGARVRGWWLVAGCASAAIGDGLTSTAAAGELPSVVSLTALLWAGTGMCVAVAAHREDPHEHEPPEESSRRRWMVVRVFLPLAAVLALPIAAGVIALGGPLKAW